MNMTAIFAIVNTTEYDLDRRENLHQHQDKNFSNLSDLGL